MIEKMWCVLLKGGSHFFNTRKRTTMSNTTTKRKKVSSVRNEKEAVRSITLSDADKEQVSKQHDAAVNADKVAQFFLVESLLKKQSIEVVSDSAREAGHAQRKLNLRSFQHSAKNGIVKITRSEQNRLKEAVANFVGATGKNKTSALEALLALGENISKAGAARKTITPTPAKPRKTAAKTLSTTNTTKK